MVDPRRPPGARAAGKHRALYVCSMYIYEREGFPFSAFMAHTRGSTTTTTMYTTRAHSSSILLCVKGPAKVKTIFSIYTT